MNKEKKRFSAKLNKSVEWMIINLSPGFTAVYCTALLLVAGIIITTLFILKAS